MMRKTPLAFVLINTLAICLVNVVKDNDMLKINEPTHNHA